MLKKQFEILLTLSVILGVIGIILLTYTFNSDINYTNKYDKEYFAKTWQLKNMPVFDYLHGLWLMPMGVMFIFIIIILQTQIKIKKKMGIKSPR